MGETPISEITAPLRGERKKPLDYNEFFRPRKLKLAITASQNMLSDNSASRVAHRAKPHFSRLVQGHGMTADISSHPAASTLARFAWRTMRRGIFHIKVRQELLDIDLPQFHDMTSLQIGRQDKGAIANTH